MKKLKFLLLMLAIAPLAISGACDSGGGNNGGTQPDQALTNTAFLDLVGAAQYVVSSLEASTCAEIEVVLNNVVTIQCEGGGSIAFNLNSFDCNDGPPITATFSFTVNVDNCINEEGELGDGSFTISFFANGGTEEATATLDSSGVSDNGFTFVFDDITIVVDIPSATATSCSGSAIVNGFTCDVNADCSGCTY